MDLGLDGKVAVVTAASKGLGLASARALAEEGAKVVINARSGLAEAAASIPGEVITVAGDMSAPDTPGRVVAEAVARFGGVDVVVANNGGPPPGRALDVSDDDVRAAVEANLLSSVRLVRAAVPHMRRNGWGRICCITSYGVVWPIPSLPLSNLARGGLYNWARTAASELAPDGITLNLACPGPHDTERMRQLGGDAVRGDPADFGRVVAFLCSRPAAFLTGQAVVVDGGATAVQ
ncbi:MAG TPA: SDR family oxidoreductase [Acidimicrobiales bacterium]|nr:SDR family oxidoreductase [Acidimicrobiales bacterium]